MRADALNSYGYPVRTEMAALSSNVCYTYEDESKGIITNKTLSQICSTDENESCSTEEDKSECAIKKQKDANNEVTYDVTNYFNAFNVFKCGRKFLDRIDVSYERACMATERRVYFTKMLDYLLDDNECHDTPSSRENIQEAVIKVMEDNVNNVTMDTLFQYPVTINPQKKDANMTN